jgi:YHS domain-containing protein
MIRPNFVLFFLLLSLLMAVNASAKTLVNTDRDGIALSGYDPVAYFTQGQPVRGQADFTSTHAGAIYRFASAENKASFDAQPAKYAPAFGGFCGYAASRGYTAKIDPEAFLITSDGRLVLQYDRSVLARWNKDPEGHLKKADANWPAIVEKHGK